MGSFWVGVDVGIDHIGLAVVYDGVRVWFMGGPLSICFFFSHFLSSCLWNLVHHFFASDS